MVKRWTVGMVGTRLISMSLLSAVAIYTGCGAADTGERTASPPLSEDGIEEDIDALHIKVDGLQWWRGCAGVRFALHGIANNLSCVESEDLTTNNEATTPPDNSLAGLPAGAWRPRDDRQILSPQAPFRTPITKKVPGLQIAGTFADKDEARFLVRLPRDWNGRLVTGVPPSTRSEHTYDYVFSDYIVQQGYAYIASNKGMYNQRLTTASDPLGCQAGPPGGPFENLYIHFYFLDPQNSFKEWSVRTVQAAKIGKRLSLVHYGRLPARNYLIGASAGGWALRHIIENYATHFDGALDWEGVLFHPDYNLMRDYPVALTHWPAYLASGLDETTDAYKSMLAYGFADDFKVGPQPGNPFSPKIGSSFETHANQYWQSLHCFVAKKIDPTYSGPWASYDYGARDAELNVTANAKDALTLGKIRRPVISVSGTMDQLAMMKTDLRVYRDLVVGHGRGNMHRLYEVQNGTHIDKWKQDYGFAPHEFIMPHAQEAFDHLVRWVEKRVSPPEGQCIPKGGKVVPDPKAVSRPEHCAKLYEP